MLPGVLGWAANLLGIAYVIVTTVLFLFPPALPVSGSNMNYCVVAFFVVLVISVLQWIFDGRKNFKGPRVEVVGGQGVVGNAFSNGDLSGKEVDEGVGELGRNNLTNPKAEGEVAELDGRREAGELRG